MTPRVPEQDYHTGVNDLYAAKVAKYKYKISNLLISEGFDNDWMYEFQVNMQ